MYDGVDISDLRYTMNYRNDLKVRFAMCGSIMEAKGQMTVIKYINNLPEEFKNKMELHLYGSKEGDDYREALKFVRRNNLEEIVVFEGYTENIWDVLLRNDFAINYSNAEAFGRVTVEYMLAGLPVIAVDTGANKELLGDYGLIVPKDDEDSFLQTVINVINNKDEYKASAYIISQYAQSKFSAETNLKEIIKCFRNMAIQGNY